MKLHTKVIFYLACAQITTSCTHAMLSRVVTKPVTPRLWSSLITRLYTTQLDSEVYKSYEQLQRGHRTELSRINHDISILREEARKLETELKCTKKTLTIIKNVLPQAQTKVLPEEYDRTESRIQSFEKRLRALCHETDILMTEHKKKEQTIADLDLILNPKNQDPNVSCLRDPIIAQD